MADKKIRVCKKILWTLNEWTEEKMEVYGNNNNVESPVIKIKIGDITTKWTLRFYPDGNGEDSISFVSTYLFLQSASSMNFEASFQIGVVSAKSSNNITDSSEEKHHLTGGLGWKRLMKRQKLFDPANKYVNEGRLTVFCYLTIRTLRIRDDSIIESDFAKMFEDDVLADFEIHTNDKQMLKAHKAILAARSPVFYAMLCNDSQESQIRSVKIGEFDSMVIRELLRFIYCNRVEGLRKVDRELVFAAHKYQLDDLKQMCIDSITSTLDLDNVLESFEVSFHVSSAGHLMESCLDMIVGNYEALSTTSTWDDMPRALVKKITRHAVLQPNIILT